MFAIAGRSDIFGVLGYSRPPNKRYPKKERGVKPINQLECTFYNGLNNVLEHVKQSTEHCELKPVNIVLFLFII